MNSFWRMLLFTISIELIVAGIYFARRAARRNRPWWGWIWLVLLTNLITIPPLLFLMPHLSPSASTVARQAGYIALAASLVFGLLLVLMLRARTRPYQMLFAILAIAMGSLSCLVFTILVLGFGKQSQSVSRNGIPFWLSVIVAFAAVIIWETLLLTGFSRGDLRLNRSSRLSLLMNTASFGCALLLALMIRPGSQAAPKLPLSTPTLAAPISDLPAAGICAEAREAIVAVEIWPDMPSPRCVKVLPDQHLEVTNRMTTAITARLAGVELYILPGETERITQKFGEILAFGVHHLDVNGSPAGGPEIWLAPKSP